MLLCLDEARKLGRTVRWGDSGPRLLTRMLKERGCLDQALSASMCYPTNPTQAPEALRPAAAAVLAPKIEPSLFLHLWNSILISRGIQKTCLPPRGSLLRRLTDKHSVGGWTGEYDEQSLSDILNAYTQHERRIALIQSQASEIVRLTVELGAIRCSTSWRLTAPLRNVSRFLQTLRRETRRRMDRFVFSRKGPPAVSE